MLVDELVLVCDALNVNAGEIIDQGRRLSRARVDVVEPREPHSTPVTEQDIAAGATLPLAASQHRRSAPSSGTRSRRRTN
jgi:hypothetical protein